MPYSSKDTSQAPSKAPTKTIVNNDASFDRDKSFFSDITQNSGDKMKSDCCVEQFYVPVALVIQSKTEFHDVFKTILKSIYESLISPK